MRRVLGAPSIAQHLRVLRLLSRASAPAQPLGQIWRRLVSEYTRTYSNTPTRSNPHSDTQKAVAENPLCLISKTGYPGRIFLSGYPKYSSSSRKLGHMSKNHQQLNLSSLVDIHLIYEPYSDEATTRRHGQTIYDFNSSIYLDLVACKLIFTLNAVGPKRRGSIFTIRDSFAISMSVNSRQMTASIFSRTGMSFPTQQTLPNHPQPVKKRISQISDA